MGFYTLAIAVPTLTSVSEISVTSAMVKYTAEYNKKAEHVLGG
jgi:hypothetical protein